jgi:hypothetical protein
MAQEAITLKFVVPTVLAVALGIIIPIGALYVANKYLVPVDQAETNHSVPGSRGMAELPNPHGRLSLALRLR